MAWWALQEEGHMTRWTPSPMLLLLQKIKKNPNQAIWHLPIQTKQNEGEMESEIERSKKLQTVNYYLCSQTQFESPPCVSDTFKPVVSESSLGMRFLDPCWIPRLCRRAILSSEWSLALLSSFLIMSYFYPLAFSINFFPFLF